MDEEREIALLLAESLGQKNALKKLFDQYPFSRANYWAVVDFNKHSSTDRLFIFNMGGRTYRSCLTTHGKGSGLALATKFSNVSGSNCSSLGIYKTLDTYNGIHGHSLRIQGLEPTNSKAFLRAIVIHKADYVVADYKGSGRAGRSEGCFAIHPAYINEVIDCLKDGSYLLAWHL